MFEYGGRSIIVTGGGNGIGRAHALAFASRGGSVLVNDINREAADATVEEIRANSGKAEANYDSVTEGDRIVEQAMRLNGRVDALINNAGNSIDPAGTPFSEMSREEWNRVWQVHFEGSWLCTKAAWSVMQDQSFGRILLTTSPVGLFGTPAASHYATAKTALFGLMQCLALDGAPHNIQVNALAPVATSEMTKVHFTPEMAAQCSAHYIGEFAAWLAHEDCSLTGRAFELGGGFIHEARVQLSRGLDMSGTEYTAESVAEHANKILDFSESITPGVGGMDTVWNEICDKHGFKRFAES